ncbi:NUMOD4 domain-containing protein [Streptococcus suis]
MSLSEHEIWLDAVGYEGLYQVSNFGRIKSKHSKNTIEGRILKLTQNKRGYLQTIFFKNGLRKNILVHRVVAKAFIPKENDTDNLVVNHKDGNKINNCIENLEWVTQSQNVKHAYETGLSSKTVKIIQKDLNGKILRTFKSLREAERITGCYSSRISEAINGKTKTNIHKNYIWEKEWIV